MLESLIELFPELTYGVVATGLALLGVGIELNGIQTVVGGDVMIGLWTLLLGLIAMYASVELAREKVVPGLRSI